MKTERKDNLRCEDSEFGTWYLEPSRGISSREENTCAGVAGAKNERMGVRL